MDSFCASAFERERKEVRSQELPSGIPGLAEYASAGHWKGSREGLQSPHGDVEFTEVCD